MLLFPKIILLSIFAAADCAISTQEKVDYIIYGTYAGECDHHCSLMFKIDHSKLLVDTTDSFFKNLKKGVTFNSKLGYEDFLDAKAVMQKISKLLLISQSKIFGDPDGHDQGGIFVQIKVNNTIKTFYIDVEKNKIPDELENFVELIENKVAQKWKQYYH